MEKLNGDGEKTVLDESLSDPETECGIGRFRPRSLQIFANISAFVGTYSIIAMISQTLSVYVNSQVPTLEKQFGLSSAQSGLLMSCNDIGYFVTVLFAASIARFVHIPRFLFFCIFLYGMSGLVCSVPHFIALSKGLLPSSMLTLQDGDHGNATVSQSVQKSNVELLCHEGFNASNATRSACDNPQVEAKSFALAAPSASMKGTALALIGIGMVLQGIGKSPRYPLFAVYVDDNGDRRKTGFYAGISAAASIFGPALSYGFGGVFSRIYVTLEDVDMTARDPRWIGAWWLGFLVFGVISIVISTILLLFPRRMKIPKNAEQKGKQFVRTIELKGTVKEKLKDRALAFSRLLKNPIYLFCLLTNIAALMAVGGFFAFLSKYIATQFSVPLYLANYILAGTNLSSVSLGAFFGGILTRKIRMTPRNSFRLLSILSICHVILFSFGLFLGCDQPKIIGPGRIHGGENDISNHCQTNCQCDEDEYFPICGSNGMMFHSPCYAGCSEIQRGGRLFSNCTCIPDGKARAGLCETDCKMLYPWAAINFVASLIGALSISPKFLITLRCVADKDKSTAIGVSSFSTSAFAWTLSPIIFGRILDTTCKIWQSPCESKGACELYDTKDFRVGIYIFSIVLKVISSMIQLLALWKVWNWTDWKESATPLPLEADVKVETKALPNIDHNDFKNQEQNENHTKE